MFKSRLPKNPIKPMKILKLEKEEKTLIKRLTKDIIAVEVPSDAFGILLIHGNTRLAYFHPNYKRIDLDCRAESLIGITPLSEEQAELIVEWVEEEQYYRDYRKDGWQGDIPAIQSFATLLESKGLDVNKKYAIIKIEK